MLRIGTNAFVDGLQFAGKGYGQLDTDQMAEHHLEFRFAYWDEIYTPKFLLKIFVILFYNIKDMLPGQS